jgi:hypothetical protein
MPHPARRLSLEMEARVGEHKVALHNSESAKQFQALLKKPAKAANGKTEPAPAYACQAEQKVEAASASLPMPQVTPKPTQLRVGQRAPERDPVGEMSAPPARQATRCSFTEVIKITPIQMKEAGISRFECPTCLAVREIKPKREIVKFPSHPKRATMVPNQGLHWVKRENVWRSSRLENGRSLDIGYVQDEGR